MSSSGGSWLRGHFGRRGRVIAGGVALVLGVTACQPGLVVPFAGVGTSGTAGDTGPALAAQFQTPNAVVAIPGGGIYVVDTAACVIRKIDASGVVTTIAGTAGSCFSGGDGGPATAATISPEVHGKGIGAALSLDSAGNLYFEDYVGSSSWAVRRITPAGAISTITAPDAHLQAAVVAPDGTIYVLQIFFNSIGDFGTTDVVAYDATGAQVASWPTPADTVNMAFASSTSLALGTYHGGVSRLDLTSGVVTPAATVSTSDFNASMAAAPDGTIYVGESNTVSRIDPDNTVTPIAGGPFNGSDPGTSAQFGQGTSLQLTPVGLAVTPNRGLLISSGHVVYRLDDPGHAG